MKRINLVIVLSLVTVSLLRLVSCGTRQPEIIDIDPAYSEYVSGYTSGIISRQDAIRIELVEGVPGLEDMSSKDLKNLIRIEPAIEGKVVAIGERLIDFVPDNPLPPNQFYTVYFDLDEVAEVKMGYEEFVFQFSTKTQEIDVFVDGLRQYDSHDIEYQRLEGTITTSDYEDTAVLRKVLRFELNGKELPYYMHENSYEKNVTFIVDSIQRQEKEQTLYVKWDGKPAQSFSKGTERVTISSLGDFSVDSYDVVEEEDQSVELRFSEPLQQGQNLDGIIQIEGVEGLTFKVSQNVVDVYLPNRIIGEHKLKVSTGLRNIVGYRMNKAYEVNLEFREPNPMVRLKGGGSILPNSQGLIFPFESISLKAVDVRIIRIFEKNVHHFLQVNDLDGDDELTRFGEIIAERKVNLDDDPSKDLKQWNTYVLNLEKFIKTEPGAIYQVAIKFEKKYAICDCPEEPEEAVEEPEFTFDDDPAAWNEWNWHTYGYDGYSDWGSYGEESPCDHSYYEGMAVKRNILTSNMGMIFKLDEDKSAHVAVSDMVTTQPIAHAEIEFFDYNRKEIASVVTDARGMAQLKLGTKPFLMIAKKGSQRGYMKLTDGRVNSLSQFDVDGEYVQKGVKGFLYAERGVWRPGDSLYINFILQDRLNKFPDNHPVTFEFQDPNGAILHKVSTAKNVNGVYDFRTSTAMEAQTGTYYGYVSVGNKIYSKSFKIETVKPNRLKIHLDTKIGAKKDSCLLTAAWLHGASARKLKTDVEVRFEPMETSFKGYEDYAFDSPIRSSNSQPHILFVGELDDKGEARFPNVLSDVKTVAGMLRARYLTRVYEKSGEMSIDYSYAIYSPYKHYVGMKIPATTIYDNTLETDKKHHFDFVRLDKEGERLSDGKIHVRIFKLDWNWWYDGEEDLTNFTAHNSAIVSKDTTLTIRNGKCGLDFKVTGADYGKFLFTATDEDGHQTGEVVHFDWPYWSRANRSDTEFAAMLSFATDKTSYMKGEMIKMTFPSPSNGRALVSVETSEKVVDQFWIETQKGETSYSFPATAAMSPNAFLHVTLVQPHHATKNDLPIRMYGIVPIQVDDPLTHLHPVISMPDKIRPESTTSVTVREEKGRKMTYTLAIVDDGLLDLTHFETPEPWNTFYAREALGVQTWDMYDDVIGAYAGKLDKLLSIGGDGFGMRGNGPKANRFKPMVVQIGPFELPAGGSRTHKIDIPSYVGSVRVMVVARDDESYGRAQKTVIVRKPLMVLATLPRVLGPGEDFVLPTNIFAMEDHVKNVSVRIEANDLFELKDNSSKSIQFNKVGDEIINFHVRTLKKIGVGKVKIIATCGRETAIQEIEIDIRPSNPKTRESQQIVLEPGQSTNAALLMDGIGGTNLGVLEFSTLPAINLEKRLGYLMEYPHGCVEQTTSSVFPQLHLAALSELTEKEQTTVAANIKAGIQRLRLFQTSSGGLSYWPGESDADQWGTNYAGHFLLEAELAGYRLPDQMKQRWIEYQVDVARNWAFSGGRGRDRESEFLTQAYRLYLLALAKKPEMGAMNRFREEANLPDLVKLRLASAYALVGQVEISQRLMQEANKSVASYRENGQTYGSAFRDKAIILEVQAITNDRKGGFELYTELAKEMGTDHWMSTQETAYALIAMARYSKSVKSGVSRLSYSLDSSKDVEKAVSNKIQRVYIDEKGEKRSLRLKNTGQSTLFISVLTEKILQQGTERKRTSKLEMTVSYHDMNGIAIDPRKIKQGTEFVAEVTLKNPTSQKKYDQMALNQIFPSGWEIRNTRLYSVGDDAGARYQDIRDDRVLSYYAMNPGETRTIRVVLHATYQGKFYLPSVYSDAMYDHSIFAQIPGKWIEVVPS